MIQSTTPAILHPANLERLSKQLLQDNVRPQSFKDLLAHASETATESTETTTPEEIEFDSKASLVSFLNDLLGSSNVASVNEEQMFASIIYERLEASKGEEVAKKYDALLDEKMDKHKLSNGYVYVETAARDALSEMERNGTLTTEEAETIHAQAFRAAQLDNNRTTLYDSFGDTKGVASTATATEKALSSLLQFDKGEVDSGKMPLSYQQGQGIKGCGTGHGVPTQTSETETTGTSAGDLTGLRWNPVSTDVGTLAVVLPMKLQGVGNVYVTNGSDQTVESGFHSGEDKGRLVYRFTQRGDQFPEPSILNVKMDNGTIYKFKIPSPSQLTTDVIPHTA